jgi:hypothetical protein
MRKRSPMPASAPGPEPPAGVNGSRVFEIVRFYVDVASSGTRSRRRSGCRRASRMPGVVTPMSSGSRRGRKRPGRSGSTPVAGFAVVGSTTFCFGERIDDDHVMAVRLMRDCAYKKTVSEVSISIQMGSCASPPRSPESDATHPADEDCTRHRDSGAQHSLGGAWCSPNSTAAGSFRGRRPRHLCDCNHRGVRVAAVHRSAVHGLRVTGVEWPGRAPRPAWIHW